MCPLQGLFKGPPTLFSIPEGLVEEEAEPGAARPLRVDEGLFYSAHGGEAVGCGEAEPWAGGQACQA